MRRTAVLLFSSLACSSGGSDSGSSGGSGAVSLDASKIFKGTLTLKGTITLPKGSGSGKSIQLTASGSGADITKSGSYVALAGTTPGESVPYTVTGLSEGKYSIRARVDQDGSGTLDGPGDLDGFTGGTVEAPVQSFGLAKEFDVGPAGATGVDFGIAPLK